MNTHIKTNELQQIESMQGHDRFLVDTDEFGTGGLPLEKAVELTKTRLLPTIQAEAKAQNQAVNGFETGVVSITNNQAYPFNSGIATVVLRTPRQTMNYIINAEVTAATGNVQSIEVYDKQLNGFKIRYDGTATAVTIKYYVTGGIQA